MSKCEHVPDWKNGLTSSARQLGDVAIYVQCHKCKAKACLSKSHPDNYLWKCTHEPHWPTALCTVNSDGSLSLLVSCVHCGKKCSTLLESSEVNWDGK